MPPDNAAGPTDAERATLLAELSHAIATAEREPPHARGHFRRLTRTEYENTIRDLFQMPGIQLASLLPADGSVDGFDKAAEALDISHVNIASYLEVADRILDDAIATRPEPPAITRRRISLVNRGGFVAHIVMNGDGVLLKDGQPDPDFPPAAEQNHLDQGAHERWGSFRNGASVGLFRHEDESVSPYFIEHVTIYPATYRVRTSLWSFQWDQGRMLPGRGTEAARLSVVQLTGDGRGGQHPSTVLGYFNAPSNGPLEHELSVWLNRNELIGFNTASLAPAANYYKPRRAMEFTGPGIVVDWLDIEGPLYEQWPPPSHTLLFGSLPLKEVPPEAAQDLTYPDRSRPRQLGAGMNRPDPEPGLWSVHSDAPLEDADQLLSVFLPQLFRRSVTEATRRSYVDLVAERLAAGDCFELAMRYAYRAALVSPDFLFHVDSIAEHTPPPATFDDSGLAARLSYFLWNSMPDDSLRDLAFAGRLREPSQLHTEVERLLADPRAERFLHDFVGQWLRLDDIAATDPDRTLYPEFSPYLQDSMVAETRAFVREMLDRNLPVDSLIRSDFVMLNQPLASLYHLDGVAGCQIRRVERPVELPRGGVVTQASILKVTANGTTTSPVPRGAFVLDRLLGYSPEPPPANVAAIEPDVRGTTTIREQLQQHRDHAMCQSCHQKIDPHGFALEAFDVIGGYRTRYRSIGEGDPAERGNIDPLIGIGFRLGQPVDGSSVLEGHAFTTINEYQQLIAASPRPIVENLARRLLIYATGRPVGFAERAWLDAIVDHTLSHGGGFRTLLHAVVASPLFTLGSGQSEPSLAPATWKASLPQVTVSPTPHSRDTERLLMTPLAPAIASPARAPHLLQPEERSPTFVIAADAPKFRCRLVGLFTPQREGAFRNLLASIPGVAIDSLDTHSAEAVIQYTPESPLFGNASEADVLARLSEQLRNRSEGLFSLKPVGDLPHEQLQQASFPIVGLDCDACSLAVHDILVQVEGVVHATASFGEGKATAWFDPNAVTAERLLTVLTERGVTVRQEAASPDASND
jgi:copper chaperone CopZ